MSDKLKQLTGKNPKDFEPVAYSLINTPDIDLFAELVEKDDYLYEFIKQNVAKRLEKNCNRGNFKNLLKFLKYYSPSYEEFIIRQLVKYANEDLTDIMLELFENGDESEKTYCAKYFSFIKDPLALDYLRQNAYSEAPYLSQNSIAALASFGDRDIFNDAINKLDSSDEFEQLQGARFLISYGDKSICKRIIEKTKTSPVAENIASELPYLCPIQEILDSNRRDGLYVLNLIIQGLGETVSLSQLYDFDIYNVLEGIIKTGIDAPAAIVLLNCQEKFELLTDNDEYLYDETKEVKEDVYLIKNLLDDCDFADDLGELAKKELSPDSIFVLDAINFSTDFDKLRELLKGKNPTIIIKSLEQLKLYNELAPKDKQVALESVEQEDIKKIISAL